MTSQNILARYANGVVTPLEPLDLPGGCEVTVNVPVSAAAADRSATASQSPAHSRKPSILKIIEDIHRELPPDQWGNSQPTTCATRSTTSTATPRKRDDAHGLCRLGLLDRVDAATRPGASARPSYGG